MWYYDVIRNIYLAIVPSFWHRAFKTLGISWVIGTSLFNIWHLFMVPDTRTPKTLGIFLVTGEEHLLLFIISLWFQPGEKFMVMRWLLQSGAGCQRSKPRNFSPTPQPLGRVEGLGTVKLITNGLWFTQLGLRDRTIKPLNEVVQRASGLANVSMSWKGDAPQPQRQKLLHLGPFWTLTYVPPSCGGSFLSFMISFIID